VSQWKTIVVGVDGSKSSRKALNWAAAEAADHGADLVVLNVWEHTLLPPAGNVSVSERYVPEPSQRTNEDLLQVIKEELGEQPPILVNAHVKQGRPAKVLIDGHERGQTPLTLDDLPVEVGLVDLVSREALQADHRETCLQAGPQIAGDRARVDRGHDRSMARTRGREGALEQPAADPGGLGIGHDEELGELANAIAHDRPRIADRPSRVVVGDPPLVAGRCQVVEQRSADLERGGIP